MTVFLLLAGLLLAVTLALLLPPLLRTRTPPALSPHIGEDAQRTHNVDAYRQRLAALEEEVRAGDSSRHEFERARLELQRELLQDVHAPEHRPAGVYRRTPVTAAVVALLVPLLALALYVAIGSPDALDPAARAPLPETALPDEQGPMLEEMVANLAERLRQQPDDADGWQTLARSYAALGRHAAAVEAFSRAHDLSGEDPQLLVDWAESVALDGGGRLTGEPRALIERALALEPDNGKGLWLAGFADMQSGDVPSAVSRWRRLLAQIPEGSDAARALVSLIDQASDGPAGAAAALTDTPAPAAVGSARIEVEVVLSPALAQQVSGDDSLFVFARATEGPPMPLAVVRAAARELPFSTLLDDSQAMQPGLTLSRFDTVVIGARISRSGTPTASSGDLQGFSEAVSVDAGTRVRVVIDEVVP